ncbi:hypothetical protein, partial [Cetobacterium sp.]|uniref:hypothetical protein n=1 Tax=Cetobacterium sp. TaxID=2071632 RepID=UPI003EE43B10
INGVALDSDQYNIEFSINRSATSNGNGAEIKLLYINNDTFNLFKQDYEIQIIAGYKKGISGLLFLGDIDEIEEKQDSVTILATEKNASVKNTPIIESFTPNTRQSDIVKKLLDMTGFNIGKIHIPQEYDYQLYRGEAFHGTIEESLNKMASKTNCKWYIKKDLIYFHPQNYDYDRTFINANSGLLEFNKKIEDEYTLVSKLNHTLDENVILEVEYETNKKIEVLILNSSHYSNDFVTECEVMLYESKTN